MGIDFYTTLLAGIIGLILAVLLAGLQISAKKGLQKYSRARWCLVGAFGVFGIMNLMEASLDGATSTSKTPRIAARRLERKTRLEL